ncbi:uncharacterized protein, partial [Centruroides vittatus]|uniref:uncharacterized protein n=1 Tax=Centruroides vittatus TaxID=120091 RepID=UPI00350F834A
TKGYSTYPTTSLQIITKKPPINLHLALLISKTLLKRGIDVTTNNGSLLVNNLETPVNISATPNSSILLSIINRYFDNPDVAIYTAGSKSLDCTGCSFAAYINGVEFYSQLFWLHPQCSNFQAEIFAILQALNWSNLHYNDNNISILSDSNSAIQLINSHSTYPIINNILKIIVTSNNNYSFSWIKAHNGIPGNQRADLLSSLLLLIAPSLSPMTSPLCYLPQQDLGGPN